jgi:hypothetical protein
MAPGLDDYQPFFDNIRNADQELLEARRSYDWTRIEQARTELRHAIEQLVSFIIR